MERHGGVVGHRLRDRSACRPAGAAALIGLPDRTVATDTQANIRAGAALLAADALGSGNDRSYLISFGHRMAYVKTADVVLG